MQDPLLNQRLVSARLVGGGGLEGFDGFELEESELGSVPELVAELAVSFNTEDVEIDITTGGSVGAESETERVGTALRVTLGEVLLLSLSSLGDLLVVEVAFLELGVQTVELMPSMTSSGSMTLPNDLDILRP